MAHTEDEIENIHEDALRLAEEKECMFIEHLISYLPISKATFYDYFKKDSNELNAIKEIIDKNKVSKKGKMYKKWFDSENATLQVALMKLISTDEEAHRLNGSSQKLDATNKNVIEFKNVSKQFPDKE